MEPIILKQNMTEEDIKLQYITPALTSKWERQKITMETQITDGKISLKVNLAVRQPGKRVDYLLYLSANNPIAVVEAKDNNHQVSAELQKAMGYTTTMGLPFAFRSNGGGFSVQQLLKRAARRLER